MTSRIQAFAFVVVSLVTPRAFAQTTTTNSLTVVNHADGTSQTQAITLNGVSSWYINRADCGLDTYANATTPDIHVSVGSIITSGSQAQIWVGTNCLSASARSGNASATCHQAKGGTVANITVLNSTITLPIEALLLNSPDTNNTAYDICPSTGTHTLTFFLFHTSKSGDIAATDAVQFTLTSDLQAPTTATITTKNGTGDRTITLDFTAGDFEANSQTYYFALPGACAGGGGGTDAGSDAGDDGGADAGSSDAGTATDAGTTGDGGTPVGFTEGYLPPVGDAAFKTGAAGSSGSVQLRTSKLGLSTYPSTASVGLSVRDAAGNYGVLSNIVCVTRVQTFGLCGGSDPGSAECPRGCAVSPRAAPSRSFLVLLGLAMMTLVRRRRGAHA